MVFLSEVRSVLKIVGYFIFILFWFGILIGYLVTGVSLRFFILFCFFVIVVFVFFVRNNINWG